LDSQGSSPPVTHPMSQISEIYVNGRNLRVNADTERTLLSVLRDDLALTGCKYGCGEGQCGACTVLLDGAPTRSCRTAVGDVGTSQVATVESLERNGRLHPVQEAFLKVDALQCGYCTSGMILAAVALLKKNSNPSRDEIVQAMNGQICRCGVYGRIVAAIQEAAQVIRQGTP
jgi:aerobic-type carbon monoxide dehydrogenase small subunit (CoxS/CutS family)